jgi:hypothetical protein
MALNPSGFLDQSGSQTFSVPRLVGLVERGQIRIPQFQRSFVWRSADVISLFDSIYRGFPIGTLLLWQHSGEPEEISIGSVRLQVDAMPDALHVVDGQQRMTSLFATLTQAHVVKDSLFQINFDLNRQKFVGPVRGAFPQRSIPLRDALTSNSMQMWLRNHADDFSEEEFQLADRLVGALRDYEIPAYIVTGDDHDVLREVFDRVNSAGKPLNRAQIFDGLFGGRGTDSARGVVRSLAPLGFGDVEENRIVQSLLAIRGGDVQRELRGEFSEDESPADWFDQTAIAVKRAIEFLQTQGVPHVELVPTMLPLPVLAAFFHLHQNPDPWILKLLARWLWLGWVHGFGVGNSQTPTLRRAIRAVNPTGVAANSSAVVPTPYEAVSALLAAVPAVTTTELDVGALLESKTKARRIVLLALADLKPQWADGTEIELASEFGRLGSAAVTELVAGHRSTASARGFWPTGQSVSLVAASESVRHSHGLSLAAQQALIAGDIPEFLRRRTETITGIVEHFLDRRLEPRGMTRPPLADLWLLGDGHD